jgi:hypothetical protein
VGSSSRAGCLPFLSFFFCCSDFSACSGALKSFLFSSEVPFVAGCFASVDSLTAFCTFYSDDL